MSLYALQERSSSKSQKPAEGPQLTENHQKAVHTLISSVANNTRMANLPDTYFSRWITGEALWFLHSLFELVHLGPKSNDSGFKSSSPTGFSSLNGPE